MSLIEESDKLKVLICKLRCIGYFIETQDPDYSRPIDFDEVQYGLSLIINEIIDEMSAVHERVQNIQKI